MHWGSILKTVASVAVSTALPIAGNIILPGAGGLIGGAIGNIASQAIEGNIHGFGDVVKAGGEGAMYDMIGGGIGKGLASIGTKIATRSMNPLMSHVVGSGGIKELIPAIKNLARDPAGSIVSNLRTGLVNGTHSFADFKYVGQTLGRAGGTVWADFNTSHSNPQTGSGAGNGNGSPATIALQSVPVEQLHYTKSA
ncbi:hypothetical protein [Nocardia sp. alder85J]|uniref:hypothetical protein n=1 Tax=Nocardia sp. alder85J TaxID=2862949 RepID=UPI001CD6A12E|nr:hypothetical protein [Nocardia sp. alder85J]MCX4092172.1 hypothetical protein [Nocardia sp. alder85J]